MKLLLDTHFLLWLVTDSDRLDEFPWLRDAFPLGVSPVSFLEIGFLHEVGRIRAKTAELTAAVRSDPRLVVDEPPLLTLVERALPLSWTRDPFDRLLCAHSELRRTPLCSLDRRIRAHHGLLPGELG